MTVAGLLLAAGAGTRLGGPKALVQDAHGVTWLETRVTTLSEGGCAPVLVTVGAEADRVRAQLPRSARAVEVAGWEEGMGTSLRTGLAAAERLRPEPAAVLVALVDTPGLTAAVVRRLAALATEGRLAQATYAGRPGHPVLLGRQHWAAAAAAAVGDAGARAFLRDPAVARVLHLVECGDLGDGHDVDVVEDLPPGTSVPPGV